MERSSSSDPALHGALDDFLGARRLRQFLARRKAAQDVDQLVHESDEENHEAAGRTLPLLPERNRQRNAVRRPIAPRV